MPPSTARVVPVMQEPAELPGQVTGQADEAGSARTRGTMPFPLGNRTAPGAAASPLLIGSAAVQGSGDRLGEFGVDAVQRPGVLLGFGKQERALDGGEDQSGQ